MTTKKRFELMPCVWCDAPMFWLSAEGLCCENGKCGYLAPNAVDHNTFARRAEIGRLVEEMAVNGNCVRLCGAIDLHGPFEYTAEFHGDKRSMEHSATLLEALRTLAKEIS